MFAGISKKTKKDSVQNKNSFYEYYDANNTEQKKIITLL